MARFPNDHYGDRTRVSSLQTTTEAVVDERAEFVGGLYREYGPSLLSYALRLTAGDRQRAEDVVQETLVRAWRNAAALTPDRGSVRSWLMRVAHNVTVDGYRARNVRPREVEQDKADDVVIEDYSEDVLMSVVVAKTLSRLSPDHRAVLVQVYFHDRTAAEAAQVLGIPVGTVKSRVHYALRILRPLFAEEPELAR